MKHHDMNDLRNLRGSIEEFLTDMEAAEERDHPLYAILSDASRAIREQQLEISKTRTIDHSPPPP